MIKEESADFIEKKYSENNSFKVIAERYYDGGGLKNHGPFLSGNKKEREQDKQEVESQNNSVVYLFPESIGYQYVVDKSNKIDIIDGEKPYLDNNKNMVLEAIEEISEDKTPKPSHLEHHERMYQEAIANVMKNAEALNGVEPDPYHPDTQKCLLAIEKSIQGLLPRDFLGKIMHRKEAEVERMVAQAKGKDKNELPIGLPLYKGGKNAPWRTPLDYLEEQFGRYLSCYNEEKIDYLYLDQLGAIYPKFRGALKSYLERCSKYGVISEYVPPKKIRTDKKARELKFSDGSLVREAGKVSFLLARS